MDCYLVDTLYLEAFWGASVGNFDMKPIDGNTFCIPFEDKGDI